jgi:hypothetical protein
MTTTVSTKRHKQQSTKVSFWRKRRPWLISGVVLTIVLISTVVFLINRPVLLAAPEAEQIIAAQQDLKFGILIPTYMPKGFDRETVELKVNPAGASGEPVVDLTYRNTGKKAAIFFRQWVPGNPDRETLNKSVPIETLWGKGWLMTQGGEEGIGTLWVLVGQLRVSVSTSNLKVVSAEQLLQMANTLALASEEQVYTFHTEPVPIRGVAPPPPVEIPINAEGIQELNLTITPGGYTPVRFAVKKGIPVRINFRALGEVGCGDTGQIALPDRSIGLNVTDEQPLSVVEFTPDTAGDMPIFCSTNCYRGIMTVRD